MRLPDIVGVELTGKPAEGITATDVVLSLTEFLRKEKVVGAYLEFFGEGAAKLTLGDRATISNMAPEFGATAAMFYIDEQTIEYLKLTGRDDEQVKLVETYAKETGLWADSLDAGRIRARAEVRSVDGGAQRWPARRTRIAGRRRRIWRRAASAARWRTSRA